MKESSTYQAILAEGRREGETQGAVAEARKLLRLMGDEAFGPPDARAAAVLDKLADLDRLEALIQGLRHARTWQELLAPSPTGRRGGRKPSA